MRRRRAKHKATTIAIDGDVAAIALDANAERVAIASGTRVRLHRVVDGELLLDVPLGATAGDLQFSPDGAFVAVELHVDDEDVAAHVFTAADGTEIVHSRLEVPSRFVGIAIDARTSRFAFLFDMSQLVTIVDLCKHGRHIVNGDVYADLSARPVALAWNPAGDRLAVAWGGTVRVFEVPRKPTPRSLARTRLVIRERSETTEDVPEAIADGPGDDAELLGFSPDGKRLLYIGERIEMIRQKQRPIRIPGPTRTVTSVIDVALASRSVRASRFERPAGYRPIRMLNGTHVIWARAATRGKRAKSGPLLVQSLATGRFRRLAISTSGPIAVSDDGTLLAHLDRSRVRIMRLPRIASRQRSG